MRIRNLKMRTVIISIVAISSAIGIILLCLLAAYNSNEMLKDKINDNMSTYLSAQESSIEKFVADSEQKLVLFSKNKLVSDLIEEDLKDFKSKGYYQFKKDGTERPLPMFNAEGENTAVYFGKNYSTFANAQA